MLASAAGKKTECFRWVRAHEFQVFDLVTLAGDDPQEVPMGGHIQVG